MRNLFKLIAIIPLLVFANIGYTADMKVGFIYIGPPGDHGWNYQHDVGRKAVDKAFGDKVETVFQENVPESADAERVMTQMALSGADMRSNRVDFLGSGSFIAACWSPSVSNALDRVWI